MHAYIFDLDGTLLDSMGVWEQIDRDFLHGRGFEVPPDFIDTICPMSFPEAAEYTIQRFNLPDSVEDLLGEWNSMAAHAYGNTVPLKPHAGEYLRALKGCGARLAVATSLPPELYEPALENCGIRELFDAVCSTGEVACGKSEPDVFLLAARRLGATPEDCVVFEDLPEAILSAKRAGMTVYGIYDKSSEEHWATIRQTADDAFFDFSSTPLPE